MLKQRTRLPQCALPLPCVLVLSHLDLDHAPWVWALVLTYLMFSGSWLTVGARLVLSRAASHDQSAGYDHFQTWLWPFRVKEGQGPELSRFAFYVPCRNPLFSDRPALDIPLPTTRALGPDTPLLWAAGNGANAVDRRLHGLH